MSGRGNFLVLCVAVLAATVCSSSQADYSWITERVNLNRFGLQSNGGSWAPAMSADGRYVAVHSWASDLVAGDSNGHYDVYVRDRLLGANYMISSTWDGHLSNDVSYRPAISADGMSVAFYSPASNLVPGDTNGVEDVFVRDWTAGVIERVSVATSGEQGNGDSEYPVVSGDGRYVAFRSVATNLIPGGNPYMGVYVRDRLTGTTECVSVSSTGELATQNSSSPAISNDGRYVVFTSWGGRLVPGDRNNTVDVFLRDRQAGMTERISVSSTGIEGNASSSGPRAAITPDGRFVAFGSTASNLVPGDTNGYPDVFVRDRLLGTTEIVSVSTAGARGNNKSGADSYELAISDDGRYVAFCSLASNLVPGDTNNQWDTFVRDRWLGTTERVSISTTGAQPYLPTGYYGLGLSADGMLRIFDSHSHNLVPGDTSTCINTFLRRPFQPPVADFSASPTTGAAPLSVQFTDASIGAPTSWAWSFGDGNSSGDRNPTHRYLAAGSFIVALTVANSDGTNTATKAGYITAAPTHNLSVTASASPATVPSGGSVALSASASDSLGHSGFAWSWSDNGAGGAFSPSSSIADATYTAPGNTSGAPRSIGLTATATCMVTDPWLTASATVPVTEGSVLVHAVGVNVTANPSTITSGGTTQLAASATDTYGHGIASWLWSDGGAGGSFLPSTVVQRPSYTAPVNTSNKNKTITLRVIATCSNDAPASGSGSVSLTVQPAAHTVTVTASATPTSIASGGSVKLSTTVTDSLKHTGFAYNWTDNGAGGTFSPSAAVKAPTYIAPPNTSGRDRVITFTVTATCKWWTPWVSGSGSISVIEGSAPVNP